MDLGVAAFWGAVSAGAVLLGQLLAPRLRGHNRAIGLLMGFGAGTLVSAIAYELIPESVLGVGPGVAVAFLVGAATYFLADLAVDRAGGADRTTIGEAGSAQGSGTAMFLGALLDGIPESFILGIGLAAGEGVSVAFLAAVVFSNVPEGAAGTLSLEDAGVPTRRITAMWSGLAVTGAVAAVIGVVLADEIPNEGLYAQAFAGGAMLVMLADTMMPEAFEHGGRLVGLLTVVGFLVAGVLSIVG